MYINEKPAASLTDADQVCCVEKALTNFSGQLSRVLIIPPDATRIHSRAGDITRTTVTWLHENVPACEIAILPALGTHFPMKEAELKTMFGDIPLEYFHVHNWRTDIVRTGSIPASFVRAVSQDKADYEMHVEVNRMIVEGGYDLILSIGQVVPHEVVGMANGNKNILVGTGGADTINKSHYLGAVCNMEKLLGRAKTPVRDVFDYAEETCLSHVPIVYIHTVMAYNDAGEYVMRGLYAGTGNAPFLKAAALSQKLNITCVDKPLKKVVVYLDPDEYKSTWLGNKAIYRTRMAMADEGELIILAPGLDTCGEDPGIDVLVRKYGYCGTPGILDAVSHNEDLRGNLSAAAHLIHGSSEGRFSVTYAPGRLPADVIEKVGYIYGDIEKLMTQYQPTALRDGFNTIHGEEFYFIRNPAVGLWSSTEIDDN